MSPFSPLLIFLFFFSSFTIAWDYSPPPDCSTTQASSEYFSSPTGPSTVYPPVSSSIGPSTVYPPPVSSSTGPGYPPVSSSTGPGYPPPPSSTGPSTTYPPSYPPSSHVSVTSTSTTSSRSYTYGSSTNSTTSIHGGSGGYTIGGHKSHGGTIAGSVIGGIVGICIIVVGLFFYCQRRRRRSPAPYAAATGYGQVGGYNQQVTETPSQPVTYVRSHAPLTSSYACVLMCFSTHRAQKTHLRPPGTKQLQTRLTLLRHLPCRIPEKCILPPSSEAQGTLFFFFDLTFEVIAVVCIALLYFPFLGFIFAVVIANDIHVLYFLETDSPDMTIDDLDQLDNVFVYVYIVQVLPRFLIPIYSLTFGMGRSVTYDTETFLMPGRVRCSVCRPPSSSPQSVSDYRKKWTDVMTYSHRSSCISLGMRSSCFVSVAHSCDGCGGSGASRYKLADTLDGRTRIGSNGGGSSPTWWEE